MTDTEVDKLIEKELSKGWKGQIEGFPKKVVKLMLKRNCRYFNI